ncbi:MAG: hypothetical protein CM1200mP10_21050 [Candidatus Neomarinimicrobiota bacterium]|nr:MAG: hypothetical protein CM1200mP10_21050 [Candidatus Neomarinimicrobiota bacterium]
MIKIIFHPGINDFDPENSSFQDNHRIMIGSILRDQLHLFPPNPKMENTIWHRFPILMAYVLTPLQSCSHLVALDMMVKQKIH